MALGMRGGVRYEYRLPQDQEIHTMPLPQRLLFSIPPEYTVFVCVGDAVSRDAVLARHSDGSVVVCTVCGMVSDVREGIIEIVPVEAEKKDAPLFEDFTALDADTIVDTIRSYGIFTESGIPFWRVLAKMKGCGELLVLNTIENEPGVYTAHAVLHAMPEKIAGGLKIIMKALALGKAVIAATDRMQKYVEEIQKHFRKKDMTQIVTVADKYPVSHPKVLYRTLTGSEREPSLRNAVIVSLTDCIAVYDLFTCGHSPAERVITVGEQNYLAYIGTPISDIAALCGILLPEGVVCHVGGYVGAREGTENEAVSMSTSAVQFLPVHSFVLDDCIECGKCVTGCPVGLQPMRVFAEHCTKKWLNTAQNACIDCGVCTSVCPVGISPNWMIHQRRADDEK